MSNCGNCTNCTCKKGGVKTPLSAIVQRRLDNLSHLVNWGKSRMAVSGGTTLIYLNTVCGSIYGHAVCSPRDEFDPLLGEEIALGRALRSLELACATPTNDWGVATPATDFGVGISDAELAHRLRDLEVFDKAIRSAANGIKEE